MYFESHYFMNVHEHHLSGSRMRVFSIAIVFVACFFSGVSARAMGMYFSTKVDSIPRNLSPANDTTFNCIPKNVTLRWSPGTSFDNSYFVEVASDSTFENPLVSEVVVINTALVCPVPQADTLLYWRVRTQFDTTAIWHFSLKRPQALVTIAPTADTITDNPVKFVWSFGPGGDRTEILIEGDAYTRRDTVSKDTSFYATLLGFKAYTWRVRTLCGDGFSDWSTPRSFYLNTVTNDVAGDVRGAGSLRWEADLLSHFIALHRTDNSSVGNVRILSLLGSTVCSADIQTASGAIDIRALAGGVYLLVVGDGTDVVRFNVTR